MITEFEWTKKIKKINKLIKLEIWSHNQMFACVVVEIFWIPPWIYNINVEGSVDPTVPHGMTLQHLICFIFERFTCWILTFTGPNSSELKLSKNIDGVFLFGNCFCPKFVFFFLI